ncbi:hypothetical protein WG66_006692 [Moniliophthora roreri]|nr:hypothetical protein WG66_006692 [Moniliophthora roreri]
MASSSGTLSVSDDSPLEIRRSLLETFLAQHVPSLEFFLNQSRFVQCALSTLPSSHSSRPCRGLMNTVYYVASSFNKPLNPPSQVLLEAVGILSTNHPNKILHAIQAEVLLATWFLHSNRILQGKYHLGTAVSLTVGAGLHRIRSRRNNQTTSHRMSLPPAVDSVEEGERIIGFWKVFALSNIWDTISGPTSSCIVFNGDGKSIDTPWAWEVHEYEQYTLPENLVGGLTVHNFLVGAPSSAREGLSMISMLAKASVLFSKAKSFADSVPRTQLNQAQLTHIQACHEYLDNLIDKFTSSLAPIPQDTQISASDVHLAVLIHTLAYTSAIHLHSPFAATDARSSTKSLSVAELATGLLPYIDYLALQTAEGFPIVNPIFGALWFVVGKVFVEELRRLRGLRRSSSASRTNEVFAMLGRLKATMAAIGQSSPFVADQLRRLTESQ